MTTNQDQLRRFTEVSLSANAFVTKRGKNGTELIGSDGLHNWTSDETIISIYFFSKSGVKFDLLIKCKVLPNGESKLQLTLDGISHSVSVIGTEYHTFPVGSYEVKSRGYHKIDLKGVNKSGSYFADVSHLVFGQPSTDASIEGIAANPDRSTPALHLWYDLPTNSHQNVEYYYNEVNVVKEEDPLHTYFMAIGFSVGYFGIQVNSETERRILFSVWSPQNTEDQHKVTDENRVKLIAKGKNVIVENFDHEGTGGHAYTKYKWQTETTYRFLVRGRPDPTDKTQSIYTGWIALEDGVWQLVASFGRPKTNQYLSGFYSFLEEFEADTGYLTRKVRFGNQWVCDSTGTWHEVTQATLNGNSSAQKKVRYDFEGGVENYKNQDCFYLKSGGFFEGKATLGAHLLRKFNKVKPTIDFHNLPSK